VTGDILKDLTIPIFSGFIGYATNWSGVWMLFNPARVQGLPAARAAAPRARTAATDPADPGVMQGGVGWQGIIPVACREDGLDRRRQGHREGRLAR
jgi:hypothetical protein